MGRSRLLLAVAMLVGLFGMPRPAAAYGTSCSTFTFASQNAGCTYQATGPGQYRAVTASGWQVSISRNGGPSSVVLHSTQSGCTLPPLGAVSTGPIPSIAGDLVTVQVKTACFQGAPPYVTLPTPIRFQDGYISGGEPATPSVPTVPTVNPLNAANSCVARDIAPATSPGALTCTYVARSDVGEVIEMTPNAANIRVSGGGTVWSQPNLSLPGRATFSQPIGATMIVTVGPDTPGGGFYGSAGLVAAGDSV